MESGSHSPSSAPPAAVDLEQQVAALQARVQQLEAQLLVAQQPLPPSSSTSLPSTPSFGARGMGVRVLDLSRVLAGPYASMLLADMGADVIKIEMPGSGDDSRQFPPFKDDTSLYYINLNRGKRSMTLNLKSAEGRELFLGLVRTADVVLENFSPGTMDRLGLGYTDLEKINPGIVYASISGFGQTGPYSSRPGYDIIAQAMSGLMSLTGWPDSPPTRAGTAVGDVTAALFTTVGILSALQTGHGQMVDVALVDSLFATLGQHLQKLFIEGIEPGRIGNRYEFIAPYDSFKAADGWVIIAIANDAIWQRFVVCATEANSECQALKADIFDVNIKRVAHHQELRPLIEKWTSTQKVVDLVGFLNENRIPACPIMRLQEAATDVHIAVERNMVTQIEQPVLGTVKVLGNPIKLSSTTVQPQGYAPSLGEHTDEILRQVLSLSAEQIAHLHSSNVL